MTSTVPGSVRAALYPRSRERTRLSEGQSVAAGRTVATVMAATFVTKGRLSHFLDARYPAHRTALLDVHLQRVASAIGLERVAIEFMRAGRLVFSGRRYPARRAFLRRLVDNIVLAWERSR